MSHAYISIGSNMDNPELQVTTAMDSIHAIPGCSVIRRSSLYQTAPVGYVDQPDFVNAVVKIETSLSPLELLHALQQIEHQQKRVRTIKNGPRTIDCDLLTYNHVQVNTAELTLPHPRMYEREFVMKPLLEIEPDWGSH
jgi:2-amino-4-hydroxy-6-hydroxymethyldihydropteridine diphosphokinase